MGKGAFGAVYKAIHWGTGEAVAVKQIKLSNVPKSELRMIEVRSSEAPAQARTAVAVLTGHCGTG